MTVLEVDKKNKDPQRKKGRNYKLKNKRGIIVNCQKIPYTQKWREKSAENVPPQI